MNRNINREVLCVFDPPFSKQYFPRSTVKYIRHSLTFALICDDEGLCYVLAFRKNANAAMLSNYEVNSSVRQYVVHCSSKKHKMCDTSRLFNSASQVFSLLTDLKQQRKDSGKSKHSVGQQNLNTIMYEVSTYPVVSYCTFTTCAHSLLCVFAQTLKYLSSTPCSRQNPEIVKEFLTTMMPQKLTKSVQSDKIIYFMFYFNTSVFKTHTHTDLTG